MFPTSFPGTTIFCEVPPKCSGEPVAGEMWGQGRSKWEAPQETGRGDDRHPSWVWNRWPHSTQWVPGGFPTWAAPKRGNRDIFLTLKPPSSPLPGACTVHFARAWQAPLGFAESLDPWLKGEVREGHVEISFLTICPFPSER